MRALTGVGLLVLTGACTVAGPREAPRPEPAERVPGATGAEMQVRVGLLVDSPSLQVGGTAGVDLIDAEGRVRGRAAAGQTRVARRAGAGVEVEGGGEVVRVPAALTLRPVDGGEVVVNGKRYRGDVLLRPTERGLTAVNVLAMETYLLGVVPLEIGAGRPPEELEAVKAQAVAARTYAVRHMGRRESLGFDIYGSTMDQVYGGADADDPVSARAVRDPVTDTGRARLQHLQLDLLHLHSWPPELRHRARRRSLLAFHAGSHRPYCLALPKALPGGALTCLAD